MKKIVISKLEYEAMKDGLCVAFGGTRKVPRYAIGIIKREEGDFICAFCIDEADIISWRDIRNNDFIRVAFPDGRISQPFMTYYLYRGDIITLREY